MLAQALTEPIGGDNNSTIVGFGHDTIVAGAGLNTIDTGNGGSTVEVSSAIATTTVSGDGNTITAVAGSTLMLNGTADTVNGSDLTISMTPNSAGVTVIGNNDTIAAATGSEVITVGTADVLSFVSDGTVTAAPMITGMDAGQAAIDQAAITPFSHVALTDLNIGQTETVTITMSAAANGVLSNLGGGTYDAGTGVYRTIGTDAAVTAAVDGLVFTPTEHEVAPGQAVTTGFTISDIDTALKTVSDSTTTVIVTAGTTAPTILGTMANQTTTDKAAVSPLSGVSISDPDIGQTETVTVTLSDAANGVLTNLGGGNYNATTGVYMDTGSAPAVTTALDGLVFVPTAGQVPGGQTVTTGFAITDTDTAGASATDITTSVVTTAAATSTPGLAVFDTTTNESLQMTGQAYSGPVSGLTSELITATSNSLNISVSTPNWFIHGAGNDAITVNSGTNVVDGGTGSNFLTGGRGDDTFFVDDRERTADIWSTMNNFHSGGAATVWGVTPGDFTFSWVDGQGATGYTGLTLHATAPGVPTASLTLVGYTTADLTDGRLTVSYGTTSASAGVPGSTYMYIHAN